MKEIINYAISVNIVYYLDLFLLIGVLSNILYKFNAKTLTIGVLIMMFMDSIYTKYLPDYSTWIGAATAILVLFAIFKLTLGNSIIAFATGFIIDAIIQVGMGLIFKFYFGIDMEIEKNNVYHAMIFTYITSTIKFVLAYTAYKFNWHHNLIDHHQALVDINFAKPYDEHIANLVPAFFLLIMSFCASFTTLIHMRNKVDDLFYIAIIVVTNAAYLYIFINQSKDLKYYRNIVNTEKNLKEFEVSGEKVSKLL